MATWAVFLRPLSPRRPLKRTRVAIADQTPLNQEILANEAKSRRVKVWTFYLFLVWTPFPILRMVVLLSLATGLLCDMAVGPYAGKETGENALLRTLWDALHPGDILLADRLYCSYCLVAMAQQRNVDCVVRLHQGRRPDFRRGLCLGRGDRVIEWQRPARPEWMDEATYATIPETLRVRQILVEIQEPGFRPEKLVVVTTLLDTHRYHPLIISLANTKSLCSSSIGAEIAPVTKTRRSILIARSRCAVKPAFAESLSAEIPTFRRQSIWIDGMSRA